MEDVFTQSVLANILLAGAYVGLKAITTMVHRCRTSQCTYDNEQGLQFDLGESNECPVEDMEKLAELIKSRALEHRRKATVREI